LDIAALVCTSVLKRYTKNTLVSSGRHFDHSIRARPTGTQ